MRSKAWLILLAALGGLFTSRINTQLREVKGYTYGLYSGFTMGRERGQFGIRGSVRTDVTGPALADIEAALKALGPVCRTRGAGGLPAGRFIHESPDLNLYIYPEEVDYARDVPLGLDPVQNRVHAAVLPEFMRDRRAQLAKRDGASELLHLVHQGGVLHRHFAARRLVAQVERHDRPFTRQRFRPCHRQFQRAAVRGATGHDPFEILSLPVRIRRVPLEIAVERDEVAQRAPVQRTPLG